MPVFLIQSPIDPGGFFKISPQDLRHLRRVLRIKPGEVFEVRQPDGKKAIAILQARGRQTEGKIENIISEAAPSPLPLWLGVGMIRWPRMEWLVEKLTELGALRLSPLHLTHSQISSDISSGKIKRLIKISQESLKQCERLEPVRIDPPQNLKQFLKSVAAPVAQKWIFNEKLQRRQIPHATSLENFIFLIGPEGGFSSDEIELATQAGFQSVSLGPVKLRTETAAIYGACVLDALLARPEAR